MQGPCSCWGVTSQKVPAAISDGLSHLRLLSQPPLHTWGIKVLHHPVQSCGGFGKYKIMFFEMKRERKEWKPHKLKLVRKGEGRIG